MVTCWKHSHSLWIHILNLKRLLFALRLCKGTEAQLATGLVVPVEGGMTRNCSGGPTSYTMSNASAQTISSVSQSSRDTALSWFSPRGSVCTCHAWTNSWLYKLFRSPFISTFHSWKYISPSNTKWLSYWLLFESLEPLRPTEPQQSVKHPVLGVLVQQERHWKVQQ